MNKSSVPTVGKMVRRKPSIVPLLSTRVPKGLTQQQLAELQSLFSQIDANSDGRITKRELRKAASVLGLDPSSKEVDTWWKAADANRDGFVSFGEFLNIMKSNYETIDLEKERRKADFALLDKNGDGSISVEEFKAAMRHRNKSITKEDCEAFFREIDADGNGTIEYNEYVDSTYCSSTFH